MYIKAQHNTVFFFNNCIFLVINFNCNIVSTLKKNRVLLFKSDEVKRLILQYMFYY